MPESTTPAEHFDEAIVGKKFQVTFRERVQLVLGLREGDIIWFYPTSEEGTILVKKAPVSIQKLTKSL